MTKGDVHNAKKVCHMVKESAKKYDIDKIFGDKAYDNNRKNFNILDDINAESAISIRKNTSTRSIQELSIKKRRNLAYQEETRI